MLGQSRRRWPSIGPSLEQCPALTDVGRIIKSTVHDKPTTDKQISLRWVKGNTNIQWQPISPTSGKTKARCVIAVAPYPVLHWLTAKYRITWHTSTRSRSKLYWLFEYTNKEISSFSQSLHFMYWCSMHVRNIDYHQIIIITDYHSYWIILAWTGDSNCILICLMIKYRCRCQYNQRPCTIR